MNGEGHLCHFTLNGCPSLWIEAPLLGAFEYIFYVTCFRNGAFLQIPLFDRVDFVLSIVFDANEVIWQLTQPLYPIKVQHLHVSNIFH
jgi:hypothetical protein